MPSLEDLEPRALKTVLDAAETVYHFRTYLPGRVLTAMVWHFRNDARDAHGDSRQPFPGQPGHRAALTRLTPDEFDTLSGAVDTMLEDQFTLVTDDPELPRRLDDFRSELKRHKTERDGLRAPVS